MSTETSPTTVSEKALPPDSVEAALYEDIEKALEGPQLFQALGLLSDYLEDAGKPGHAACLTWCLAHNKRPYCNSPTKQVWFNAPKLATGLGDVESDLPEALYEALPEEGKREANHCFFGSRHAAFQALLVAWDKCGGVTQE